MQFLAFHNMVKSFINRKDITDEQVDFFINTGKREFETLQVLNCARRKASATYPSTAGVGVALDGPTGVNVANGSEPDFRQLAGDYSVGITGDNGVYVPLHGDTFTNVQRRTRWSNPPNSPNWPTANPSAIPLSQQSIVYYTEMLDGVNTLFLFPEIASSLLTIRYNCWVPDYDWQNGPERSDFLLNNGRTLLLWTALEVNNRFVAEEAKVPVDVNEKETAIAKFLSVDSTIPIEGSALNLD